MLPEIVPRLLALFALGAVLMAAGQVARGRGPSERRADRIKYGVFLLFVLVLLGAVAAGRVAVLLLAGLVGARAAIELGRLPAPGACRRRAAGGAAGAALGLGHLALLPAPSAALAVVLVAATDSFAQLWGTLAGRRRLCPRLSPGKTVEGLAGGVVAAVATALAFGALVPSATPGRRVAIALATAAGATAGDLLFSRVKRRARVKDFAPLLPGHGGVLDRFDSLVVGAPAFFWSWILFAG